MQEHQSTLHACTVLHTFAGNHPCCCRLSQVTQKTCPQTSSMKYGVQSNSSLSYRCKGLTEVLVCSTYCSCPLGPWWKCTAPITYLLRP